MTDAYDNLNGSVLLAWQKFTTVVPDSYNVYVNGVLNQNVATLRATVSGLTQPSYSPGTVAPTPNNSVRPQNMPPTGSVSSPVKYDFRITAVKTGVEIGSAPDLLVTPSPTSLMLKTPMRRPFPFPLTGMDTEGWGG